MASVWTKLAHALPIADLACLLFDVYDPMSILVWTGSLFPFLEVDLFNLSNKPPLSCCWDDPPMCSYCPACCRTHRAYCTSSIERCIAHYNSSSLSESMLWTTFSSVATSLITMTAAVVPFCSQWFYQGHDGNSLTRPVGHYHNALHCIHVWPNVAWTVLLRHLSLYICRSYM
jgi:hypothetical protein